MHERYFDLADITRVRFAVSPLWELVTSLRTLSAAARTGVHGPWVQATLHTLHDEQLDPTRLMTLVPVTGHIADFLTPNPTARAGTIDIELERVRQTPISAVCTDLDKLRPDNATGRRMLDAARRDPAGFLHQVVDDLASYWHAVIEPAWHRLQGLAESDIAWRLERIADRGPREALATLHPRVRIERDQLVVQGTCTPLTPARPGSGIVLVPCAFAWPEILLLDTVTQTPTIGYAPRGIATLWQRTSTEPDALTELLGRTRAQLLHLMDLPATNTQLAAQLNLTPPTTNAHLHILQRAGAVTRRRQGRSVFYTRTTLGQQLITSTAPTTTLAQQP